MSDTEFEGAVSRWRLADGSTVVDRPRSHLHLHESVRPLLADALGRVRPNRAGLTKQTVDFGRVVGVTHCVETSDSDDVYYRVRQGRRGPTRFVRGRAPEPCTSVVVVLMPGQHGAFVLLTAFIGRCAEPEPWDPQAGPASRAFWRTHALIAE